MFYRKLKLPQFISKRLEGRPELKKAVESIGWLGIEKMLQLTLALIVGILLVRYLGAEQFGFWSYALAFISFFQAASGLGMDNIIIRELVKNPKDTLKIKGTAFFLKLAASISVVILSSAIIFIVKYNDPTIIFLTLIISLGIIFSPFDVIDYYFQAEVRSKFTVWAKSIAFIIAASAKVIAIILKAPLITFAWIYTAEIAVGVLLLIVFYKRKTTFRLRKWKIDPAFIKVLLKESWPLLLSGIAIIIYMRIDQIMIGEILNERELGRYSAVARLSETWYFLAGVIAVAVFPAILRARETDRGLYNRRMQKLVDFTLWTSIGIALFMTFTAEYFITLIFGLEFSGIGNVLAIHIWAGVFVYFGIISGRYLIAEGLTKIALYRTLFGAVLNIFLNLILIPIYGITGAAISTLISYFSTAIMLLFFKKTRINLMFFMNSINPVRLVKFLRLKSK